MHDLIELLREYGYREKRRQTDPSAQYIELTKNGVDLCVGSHQSEILFDVVRKSGYTVPVISLLAASKLLDKSVVLIYEDYHVLDEGNLQSINVSRLIDVMKANWTKVDQLLLDA